MKFQLCRCGAIIVCSDVKYMDDAMEDHREACDKTEFEGYVIYKADHRVNIKGN